MPASNPTARNRAPANEPESSGGVAAVDRAFAILDAFQEGEASMTLATLAKRTGLYKSTLLRILTSLISHGYVRRLANGSYQVGPTVVRLTKVFQQSFRLEDYIVPALHELVRQTNESASFYVRDGDMRLCVFRVDSPRSVRDHVVVGERLRIDQGAGGHVLQRFGSGRDDVGRRRYVVATFGERQPDIAAVAAPVFGVGKMLHGAISVSGPRVRFTKKAVAAFSEAVLQAAEHTTLDLGGDAFPQEERTKHVAAAPSLDDE